MRCVVASLLLLLASYTFAETAALQAIDARLSKPALLQGDFEQKKSIRILSRPLLSTGEFSVVRGQGVVWTIQQPMASQLIISAQGIEGADIGDNRAMAYIAKILNQLLSGDIAVLEQQFTINVEQQNEAGWAITLLPRSSLLAKAISQVDLRGQQHIQHLLLHEASGDKTEVNFTALEESNSVPDSIRHVFIAKE